MANRSSYPLLTPFLWKQRPLFSRGLTFTIAYVLTTVALPHLAGEVSYYLGRGEVEPITRWLSLTALAFLLRGGFQYGENISMIEASLAVALDLRCQIYAHLHNLGLDFFEHSQTGDLTYRLTEDVDRIGEVVDKLSRQFISCTLQLIAIPAYMFYLNWPLTLASLILAPLMAWLISQFGRRILILSRQSQQQVSHLSSLLTEVLSSMRLVQAFAAQEYEVDRFKQEAEHHRQAKYRAQRLVAIQYPVVGFLEVLSILFLFLLGGWQISLGQMTAQSFVSYLAAVGLLIHPIDLVTNHYNEFKQAEASVERIFDLLKIQPTIQEQPDAIPLPAIQGKVEYRHVYFAYHSDRPVFQDLSLQIDPGAVIALVGPSGAGKTTLVNLLPRLYDPQIGQVLIDEIDIRMVKLISLRRQIGIVPQDITLFSGTIAQNIAYGQPDVDQQTIQIAAETANAHQFILQQPHGYQTWVGERGITLSGGQRQRVAIARAILYDPRILILDEATSSLDSESETLVQQALERAMQGRTVFIIAHRLSTVYQADRILFLEGGQILESGTHTELLKQGGRYAQFYTQQFSHSFSLDPDR